MLVMTVSGAMRFMLFDIGPIILGEGGLNNKQNGKSVIPTYTSSDVSVWLKTLIKKTDVSIVL
jgi:hypothetical protein